MSLLRERTLEMIERLPEEKIVFIFNILKDIEVPLTLGYDKLKLDTASMVGYSEPTPHDKTAKLTALFGSIDDETFRRYPQPSFSLDAEREVL